MPNATAVTRSSESMAMISAMPRSLFLFLFLLIGGILLFVVVHQARASHQRSDGPDLGLQVDARGGAGQKIDGDANRSQALGRGRGAGQGLRASGGTDIKWEGDERAVLIVGLKYRVVFKCREGSVIGRVGCAPGSRARNRDSVAVGVARGGHAAIDHVIQFLTPAGGL